MMYMYVTSYPQDCSLLNEKLTAKDVVDILVSQVPLAAGDEDYYNMEISVS